MSKFYDLKLGVAKFHNEGTKNIRKSRMLTVLGTWLTMLAKLTFTRSMLPTFTSLAILTKTAVFSKY